MRERETERRNGGGVNSSSVSVSRHVVMSVLWALLTMSSGLTGRGRGFHSSKEGV